MRKRVCILVATLALLAAGCSPTSDPGASSAVISSGLPLPTQLSKQDFEVRLYAFLGSLEYRKLNWTPDKGIRDTGPYKNGRYYGTHPAVKIYYSPEMMAWLINGRTGDIPDGAMMVKEMYPPPAARYQGKAEPLPKEWTVMVRDRAGSVDGWYWSYFGSNPGNTDPPVAQAPDSDDYPFDYPNSGFGSYCVRCHASADSLLTFASLDNIKGFPGDPIRYEVDDSWKTDADSPGANSHPNARAIRQLRQFLAKAAVPSHDFVNADWLAQYPQFPAGSAADIEHLPPVSGTTVAAQKHTQFMTSDQCMSCHAGDNSPFGPNLVSSGVDVSPHGEWQWSMMGLAGRDPIFYAQIETESNLYAKPGTQLTPQQIQNLCLHCHGVMGQRKYVADQPGQLYTLEKSKLPENHDYRSLQLDGVSCTVCHQMSDPGKQPLEQIRTGDFSLADKVNGLIQIFGPFENPEVRPMENALATKPVQGIHIRNSKLCASCHTVYLPVLDTDGKVLTYKYEQATYLEWVNSDFNDGRPLAQSCQECHMPPSFAGTPLDNLKIANVQDQDFPPSDHVANITVQKRSGYRRHLLQGANVYGLELFRNFADILGVRLSSFMTGFANGLPQAINNAADGVFNRSARVEILDSALVGNLLTTRVRSTNLVGHRFPSGVGFRRLFMEFIVTDASGQVVWGSGRTNKLGIIVDENGQPLPSEFHQVDANTGQETYEPHYQVVNQQNRVQIYEELTRDSQGKFTTSFLGRVKEVKDNRLLPVGWTLAGPAGFEPEYAEATAPHGEAATDPDFTDGKGSDTVTYQAQIPQTAVKPFKVRATLYYQAIPPRYLSNRFDQANGEGTRRLHFLTSHLDDSKTFFKDWKLQAGQAEINIP